MLKPFRRCSLLVVIVSALLAVLPSVALASHSWNGYHWARTQNPFNLKLGDNLSTIWDSYLGTTSSDWTASVVLNTSVVAGQAKGRNCRPPDGRVEVCNSRYGNNGWLGVAQIWISGTHITRGSVRVNDTYFDTPTYNSSAWRNLVMCQEVGHTIGLDHQDENFNNPNLGTCMDYTNNPATNQHPNQHDYDELEDIYAHLDSTTTVQSMPPAMSEIDFAERGQWGRLIRESYGGRTSVFLLDFGGGHKVFTFVIWASELVEIDRDREGGIPR